MLRQKTMHKQHKLCDALCKIIQGGLWETLWDIYRLIAANSVIQVTHIFTNSRLGSLLEIQTFFFFDFFNVSFFSEQGLPSYTRDFNQ